MLVSVEEQEALEETLEVLQDEELLRALRESEDSSALTELLLTNRAKQDLAAFPQAMQAAVLDTLTMLEMQPEERGKELRGRLRGLWSCRIGNYRILYTIEGPAPGSRVIIRAIRHRAVPYGRRRRRR